VYNKKVAGKLYFTFILRGKILWMLVCARRHGIAQPAKGQFRIQ
jgi:hypothetical protein